MRSDAAQAHVPSQNPILANSIATIKQFASIFRAVAKIWDMKNCFDLRRYERSADGQTPFALRYCHWDRGCKRSAGLWSTVLRRYVWTLAGRLWCARMMRREKPYKDWSHFKRARWALKGEIVELYARGDPKHVAVVNFTTVKVHLQSGHTYILIHGRGRVDKGKQPAVRTLSPAPCMCLAQPRSVI